MPTAIHVKNIPLTIMTIKCGHSKRPHD